MLEFIDLGQNPKTGKIRLNWQFHCEVGKTDVGPTISTRRWYGNVQLGLCDSMLDQQKSMQNCKSKPPHYQAEAKWTNIAKEKNVSSGNQ